jgi:hypothetical protein
VPQPLAGSAAIRSTAATFPAARTVSASGARRSAHDHQNQPSCAGAWDGFLRQVKDGRFDGA